MSIFKKIFGGNKPAGAADPVLSSPKAEKARQQTAEARKRGQTLLLELSTQLTTAYQRRCNARAQERDAIKAAKALGETLEKTKYPINDDVLKKYAVDIAALHCGLIHSSIQFLDSREIDEEIAKLASQMQDAVKRERATVAEDAFDGLCWAVTIGRSDIPETELDTMDTVITERLKVFEAYQTCVVSANSAEDVQAKLHDEQLQLKSFQTELDTVMEKLESISCYEEVEEALEMDPKYKGETSDEKYVIGIIVGEERPISRNIQELSSLIEQNTSLSMTYRHDRYTAQIAILYKIGKQYPDMSKQLYQLGEDLKKDSSQITDIIGNMIKAQDYFYDVCQSIQEGPEEKRRRIEAIRTHVEEKQKKLRLEQKKKQREAAAAAKQKEEAERLAREEAQQQDNRTVLTN